MGGREATCGCVLAGAAFHCAGEGAHSGHTSSTASRHNQISLVVWSWQALAVAACEPCQQGPLTSMIPVMAGNRRDCVARPARCHTGEQTARAARAATESANGMLADFAAAAGHRLSRSQGRQLRLRRWGCWAAFVLDGPAAACAQKSGT